LIHNLRDPNNNTVVDVETTDDDLLHATVVVEPFARMLLARVSGGLTLDDFIADMAALQDLKGEWFLCVEHRKPDSPRSLATRRLREVAARYGGLDYVED